MPGAIRRLDDREAPKVMRSFFDSALVESRGAAFIREDKVDDALRRLMPGARLTKGQYSSPAKAELRDLAWNHMDQHHRPHIHRTYGEAVRVGIEERAAFSLTRFGRWPVVIPVFDGQHKENGFYQVLCLFGLIVVVNVIECNATAAGTRMDIRWTIASHRLLGFLHPMLHRRLVRLNEIQNREDDEIRNRRVELRAAGYAFATDVPDFVNANAMANNVRFPSLAQSHSIPLADLPEGKSHRIDLPDRAYIVRRAGAALELWPGICPHEGAVLTTDDLSGSTVKCRWHGLEYGPRRLAPGDPSIVMCGARLAIGDGKLAITPALGERA